MFLPTGDPANHPQRSHALSSWLRDRLAPPLAASAHELEGDAQHVLDYLVTEDADADRLRASLGGTPIQAAVTETLCALVTPAPVQELLIMTAADTDTPAIRAAALATLGPAASTAPVRSMVLTYLDDADATVRAAAAGALHHARNFPAVHQALLACTSDDDAWVRCAALRALTPSALTPSTPARLFHHVLLHALRDDDPAVRATAAQGLGTGADRPMVRAALLDRLRNDEEAADVRAAAAEALAGIADQEDIVQALLDRLPETDAAVRAAAATALAGASERPADRKALLNGLADPVPGVRLAAARGLAGAGKPDFDEIRRAFERHLDDEEAPLRLRLTLLHALRGRPVLRPAPSLDHLVPGVLREALRMEIEPSGYYDLHTPPVGARSALLRLRHTSSPRTAQRLLHAIDWENGLVYPTIVEELRAFLATPHPDGVEVRTAVEEELSRLVWSPMITAGTPSSPPATTESTLPTYAENQMRLSSDIFKRSSPADEVGGRTVSPLMFLHVGAGAHNWGGAEFLGSTGSSKERVVRFHAAILRDGPPVEIALLWEEKRDRAATVRVTLSPRLVALVLDPAALQDPDAYNENPFTVHLRIAQSDTLRFKDTIELHLIPDGSLQGEAYPLPGTFVYDKKDDYSALHVTLEPDAQ